jgi:hypothetical protein
MFREGKIVITNKSGVTCFPSPASATLLLTSPDLRVGPGTRTDRIRVMCSNVVYTLRDSLKGFIYLVLHYETEY